MENFTRELKSFILELENTVTENIDLLNEFNTRLGTTKEISELEKNRVKLRKKDGKDVRDRAEGLIHSCTDWSPRRTGNNAAEAVSEVTGKDFPNVTEKTAPRFRKSTKKIIPRHIKYNCPKQRQLSDGMKKNKGK